jgi:ureidoacrylate peracid hydrolase
MHDISIRPEIVERVLARRGRLHLFERLDPARTAFVVIDMQGTFCEPGAPAEVPHARAIIDPINRLAAGLRSRGGQVI